MDEFDVGEKETLKHFEAAVCVCVHELQGHASPEVLREYLEREIKGGAVSERAVVTAADALVQRGVLDRQELGLNGSKKIIYSLTAHGRKVLASHLERLK